jgi:hypothetical protein
MVEGDSVSKIEKIACPWLNLNNIFRKSVSGVLSESVSVTSPLSEVFIGFSETNKPISIMCPEYNPSSKKCSIKKESESCCMYSTWNQL